MTQVLKQAEAKDGKTANRTERANLIRASLSRDEIEFDKERARRLLGVIYRRFTNGGGAQEEIKRRAPQWVYRPESLAFASPPHRVWLFCAAATDAREDSARVYNTHSQLWRNARAPLPFRTKQRKTHELYTEKVLKWSHADFVWGLAKCQFGNPHRTIEWWPRRSLTLWKDWGGDPYRMFELGSINALMEWKAKQKEDPIPGIGPKIASLIAIFLEETGLPAVRDAFPIDVHVQSLALSLRLVRFTRVAPILNETLEAILRPNLVALCEEEGWSRILLSHALWLRGNSGCRNCEASRHMARDCPVYADCQGRFSTNPYTRLGLWLPGNPPARKGGDVPEVLPILPLFQGTGE